MKTIKYIPKEAQDPDRKFDGYVEIRLPLFEEKLAYLEEFGLNIDETGAVVSSERQHHMSLLIKMLKAAARHYVKVDLKNLQNGVVYSTYEDLSCDSDCNGMLTEIAGVLLHGAKVGNG